MFVLIGSYLLLVFVLPVVLSAIVSYRALPHGRSCPQCRGDTIPLQTGWLRPINAVSGRRSELQRRWCLCCNWEGTARVRRQVRTVALAVADPLPVAIRAQTLDVRSIHVDGAAWRVMLQCWTATGLIYGRLMFVGPGGRLWLDAVEPFSGTDENQVLGQARQMPEPMLQRRLRRLVSG